MRGYLLTQDRSIRNKRVVKVLAAVFVLTLTVLVIVSFFSKDAEKHDRIPIDNYQNYVKNLPDSERLNIETALYNTISLNMDDNVPATNDALIRNDSYGQTIREDIIVSSFIIDIASIGQSYLVSDWYSSLPVEQSGLYDYVLMVTCLDKKDLIYGDFGCQDRISMENNLSKWNPILNILPYKTDLYQIHLYPGNQEDSSGIINLEVRPYPASPDDTDIPPETATRYQNEVIDWLRSNDLNPDEYRVIIEP
jgi:hypothetical protein